MKRIILVMLIFIVLGCAYADEFTNVTVNDANFEIPIKYASGNSSDYKYVFKDLRTFAILCVDDYLVSNYGGFYDTSDSHKRITVGDHDCMHLIVYNPYISKNVSYLYFSSGDSIYCICYQGSGVESDIAHIVESAAPSNFTASEFYEILKEAYDEHKNKKYLDELSNDDSYYVSKMNQHDTHSNDQLITWYLLTHR